MIGRLGIFLLLVCSGGLGIAAQAATVSVAVASNFQRTLYRLAPEFARQTGHQLRISSGSTGKLYAQIVNGAPYDVYLAADRQRPGELVAVGIAVAGSQYDYAYGELVLWSRRAAMRGDCLAHFKRMSFDHLAIANPALAPYGHAARSWLQGVGLWEAASERLVIGENIGQAFHFVASRSAAFGLVAASQLAATGYTGGCVYIVPHSEYEPIAQQAVLLERARDSAAARSFLRFLRSATAATIIRADGYDGR